MGRKYYLDPETGEKIYIKSKIPSLNQYRKSADQDAIDSAKVDKVSGKGLSTNDYDNAAKSKVDAIPNNPKYTDTVYNDTSITNRVSAIEDNMIDSVSVNGVEQTVDSDGNVNIQLSAGNKSIEYDSAKNALKIGATVIEDRQLEIDDTLKMNNYAADAKAVGDELDDIKQDIAALQASSGGGSGMSDTAKSLLITILTEALYGSNQTSNITALQTALASSGGSSGGGSSDSGGSSGGTDSGGSSDTPAVTLSSISATYTGGAVDAGTSVNSLTGITVTATYSDSSTAAVTGYTLSGTIAEGTNTVTVSYSGKTCTFTVTGNAVSTTSKNLLNPENTVLTGYKVQMASGGTLYVNSDENAEWIYATGLTAGETYGFMTRNNYSYAQAEMNVYTATKTGDIAKSESSNVNGLTNVTTFKSSSLGLETAIVMPANSDTIIILNKNKTKTQSGGYSNWMIWSVTEHGELTRSDFEAYAG